MNFLVDENVDRQIADVAEKDAGISDDEVLEMANEKTGGRISRETSFFLFP